MTAVYSPLQNAALGQRGALSTSAQEISGLKRFLDGIEAKQLELENVYTEPFTVEATPFNALGMPLSIGGLAAADDPYWGLRAQSVVIGGEVGTIETIALGRFTGDGPVDLLGIDQPAGVQGLVIGRTANGSYAALVAESVSIGETADGLQSALDFDEGDGYLRAPISLDELAAVLRSSQHPFRFVTTGDDPIAELRYQSNTNPLTFTLGTEWAMSEVGPAAFTHGTLGGAGRALVLGTITDDLLGPVSGVHLIGGNDGGPLVSFGGRDGGGYASVARVHYTGAYEANREAMGAADSGVVLGVGSFSQMEFTVVTASGTIDPPAVDAVESITIKTPAVKATSIPRIEVVGQPLTTDGNRPIAVIEDVADGEFTLTFRNQFGPATPTGWAVGGTGSIRWEVSR